MEEASNRDLEYVDMDQIVQEINKRKKKVAINSHVQASWLKVKFLNHSVQTFALCQVRQ